VVGVQEDMVHKSLVRQCHDHTQLNESYFFKEACVGPQQQSAWSHMQWQGSCHLFQGRLAATKAGQNAVRHQCQPANWKEQETTKADPLQQYSLPLSCGRLLTHCNPD